MSDEKGTSNVQGTDPSVHTAEQAKKYWKAVSGPCQRFRVLETCPNPCLFGFMYKALDTQTGKHVAVKLTLHSVLQERTRKYLETQSRDKQTVDEQVLFDIPKNEIQILRHLNGHAESKECRSLMQLVTHWEDEQHNAVLVTDWAHGGDLMTRLINQPSWLDETTAQNLFRQLAQAVRTMHRCGVHHLDLSPENVVFLDAACTELQVIDFGLSRIWKEGDSPSIRWIGKRRFAAPEVVDKREADGCKCDVYSLGVMLAVMVGKCSPYDTLYDSHCTYWRQHGIRQLYQGWNRFMTDEVADLIQHMMEHDASKRWTLEQVLSHPWLVVKPTWTASCCSPVS